MSGLAVHTDPERLEVTFERELPADPEAVWDAWTDPLRLAAWWGPAGWRTVVRVLDLRPGGLWHFGMGPEGADPQVWIRAIFTEVLAGSSLSYLEGFSDAHAADLDPEPNAVTVDLVGLDAGRTRLVMRTRFASASRLSRITEMGMTEGWREGFDRLEALLTGVPR
jgi:uncharacterized protein YndB with AHSA1/START domain